MHIHPIHPEPLLPENEPGTPNPTHLPVEPEFGPLLPLGEPDEPGARPHKL